MEKETHVFIQTKWKNKSEPVKSINHFTQCCNNIMKDLMFGYNLVDPESDFSMKECCTFANDFFI